MAVTDGFKMGYFVWCNKPVQNPNFYLLNGQSLVRNGNRVKFIDYVKSIESYFNTLDEKHKVDLKELNEHLPNFFVSSSDYENQLHIFETCGKFVWQKDNSLLKLPTTTEMVQKDIITYNQTELENSLKNYTICFCYTGLTSWDKNNYLDGSREMIRIRQDIPFWAERVYGYLYLLVNDLNIDYYLNTEIPNAIILKTSI